MPCRISKSGIEKTKEYRCSPLLLLNSMRSKDSFFLKWFFITPLPPKPKPMSESYMRMGKILIERSRIFSFFISGFSLVFQVFLEIPL